MKQVIEFLKNLPNKIWAAKNWILLASVVAILIWLTTWIVAISGENFSLKEERNNYKKTIKEYDNQLLLLAQERDSVTEVVHYYKWLSDSLQGIQENTHYQTTKIIYKTNEEIKNVDKLSADSNIKLFSKLSQEYINDAEKNKKTN